MFYRKLFPHRKKTLLYVLLTVGMLTACGQEQDASVFDSDSGEEAAAVLEKDFTEEVKEDTEEISKTDETTDDVPKADNAEASDESSKVDETVEDELKQRFGANCILEQTFEVEFSEYDGKVWFVPLVPMGAEDFHMQIIQNEEVLTDISGYVPEELKEQEFSSLDAVAFFDVNYDNMTDIVLIETYGDTSFAAVYYGEVYTHLDGLASMHFFAVEEVSDNLTSHVENLTIPAVRNFLSNGKKNGEFEDYREAYLAIGKLKEMECGEKIGFELVYFDEDDIPELVADHRGYFMNLYSYHDGKIYILMNEWGYGAGGNSGYEYCPGKGSVRNYDADYAGLILYTTYWKLGDGYQLDHVVSIKFLNFIDANGNGLPDGDEEETAGYGDKSYVDGVEITWEEANSYNMGEYEWLGSGANGMNFEELTAALSE